MNKTGEIDGKPNGPGAPDEDPNLRIIIWHTNCMLFVALVLLPSGMFVSRYFKETWTHGVRGKPIWLLAHIAYMLIAFIISVYGVSLALSYTRPVNREATSNEKSHRLFGWITVGLMALQIVLGFFLPTKKVKAIYHHILRIVHWFIGGSTTAAFLIIAMFSGLLADAQYPFFSNVIILVWMICALAMHFVYAWHMHQCDKPVLSRKEDGCKNYYRLFLPLPVPILLENATSHKLHAADFRLVLYLWFQFMGCAAFCVILLANSEGYGEYHCKDWAILQLTCSKYVPHIRY